MTETTRLDAAFAAMIAAPEGADAPRLAFYAALADSELCLLLEEEPEGDTITPRIFGLDEGPFVLVFDSEDRLAAFAAQAVPFAAIPGRVIAGMLAGQGLGLGLNLGVAPSEFLLPADAVDWLAETLGAEPEALEARPERFTPPGTLPEALLDALAARILAGGGLARRAALAGVDYTGGGRGHVLAFLGAEPKDEPALAKAVAEALAFSGVEAGTLDVTFLDEDGAAARALLAVARVLDLPQPAPEPAAAPDPAERPGPGMDPARPPILR